MNDVFDWSRDGCPDARRDARTRENRQVTHHFGVSASQTFEVLLGGNL